MWYLEYVDKEIATSLLMWINTDTNIFYNTNTSTRTFRYATELFELGWDQRTIVFELFKKKKFSKSKLWGESLSIAKSHEWWKIVWSIITHEMYEKTSTSEEDTSWLINEFFTNIEWAKVAYLLSEAWNWVKCSMRSFDAKHNVSEIAKKFWGGWHIQAAGFYIEWGSIETLEKRLVEALKKIVNIDK
jgi:phosphoesterase RecJ-like protein